MSRTSRAWQLRAYRTAANARVAWIHGEISYQEYVPIEAVCYRAFGAHKTDALVMTDERDRCICQRVHTSLIRQSQRILNRRFVMST